VAPQLGMAGMADMAPLRFPYLPAQGDALKLTELGSMIFRLHFLLLTEVTLSRYTNGPSKEPWVKNASNKAGTP
jgi:hypothetical protein